MLILHEFKPKTVLTGEELAFLSKELEMLARLMDAPDDQQKTKPRLCRKTLFAGADSLPRHLCDHFYIALTRHICLHRAGHGVARIGGFPMSFHTPAGA